ncbi:F-box only protein 43 isoform X1 [Myotis lucifugus]|uniref:F-box only protein 43 isoform X1 n=1 Tax=Myotis lucifugus TaxID=59463 RepID=UPI000CCC2FAE|nr:F-box only protein 43 isoform X1 [Myotis lucifugus]
MKQVLKMSERHSGQVGTGVGNEMDSPTVTIKYTGFKDFSSTSSFQDSGYSELLKSYSVDNTLILVKQEDDPTINYEFFEPVSPGLTDPLETPTKRKRFLIFRKKSAIPPDFCETPKLGKRYLRRRRRLDVSFSPLKRNYESDNSSIESSISEVLNFEEDIPSSASGSPRQNNFSALVTSTLKTEEATLSPQKLRLNFSQQKTSTVDDSKDDCSLFEDECISPIQGNNFKDSITHDFSDSSPCVNDENTFPKLLGSSSSGTTCETDEDIFVTPISNLVANIKFKAGQRFFPQVRGNISTPEDSGFNSLCLDKSEDSLSDQESSFQELLQKHKGTLKVEDTIRRSRRLGRLRRLSTLREQGSQSETEEESQTIHSESEITPAASSDISESQPSSDSQSEELILGFNNLSNTPALQLVHELFMKNKKRRFQQSGTREFLEDRDEAKIAVLQCVLAGLIGKKMGIEKLDILTELKYRNLKHILAVVLDSLSAESLCSVWSVSRNWREIIVQNKKANQRRRFYLTQLKTDAKVPDFISYYPPELEISSLQVQTYQQAILNVQDAATRFQLSNRSALRSVQAQARTPSSQKEQVSTFSPWGEVLTPIASSSIIDSHSKQEEYVRVAKTLFTDEALKPCPRCQSPAKYQPYKKRGLCSRRACGFDFCVLCLCAYHGSEECSRRAARPRNRKDPLPGSAQSKRNLKRL